MPKTSVTITTAFNRDLTKTNDLCTLSKILLKSISGNTIYALKLEYTAVCFDRKRNLDSNDVPCAETCVCVFLDGVRVQLC